MFSGIGDFGLAIAYPIDSLRLAAGGKTRKPVITGIGADPGHHEQRRPSTRLPIEARVTVNRAYVDCAGGAAA